MQKCDFLLQKENNQTTHTSYYVTQMSLCTCNWLVTASLKDNSTMYKIEAQIVSYGILYLKLSSHQCKPSYKKYIAV